MNQNIKNFINKLYKIYSNTLTNMAIFDAKRNFPDLSNIENPIFIIGLPGSLCLVNLCIKFIPEHQKIVFVSNGLDEWENNWARNKLDVAEIINIKRKISHGSMLDLLFERYPRPFGILDYDCFVLDPSYFLEIQRLKKTTLVNALFVFENKILNLDIPETYFMFFNTPLINKIIEKFQVNSMLTKRDQLSTIVKNRLLSLGIDQSHYPEGHKNYYDTLRLLILLGITEGYKCNFIKRYPTIAKPYNDIFHVGGGHNTGDLTNTWRTRGTYLWRRSLEVCNYPELQKYYWDRFGWVPSRDIIKQFPEVCKKIGSDFFSFLEEIINYEG